ncbi:MAG: biopolymer transporter ExbD [Planctomycetota bacterium]|nr:biopolymer transporter ExbD [Planctomycetota bacterium]
MEPPPESRIEVDMVPMIDIITLLLMFLVIVGDMAATAGSIQMRLPRADQAVKDRWTEDRLVVQLQNQNGVYRAVINNRSYDLVAGGASKTLRDHLADHVNYCVGKGWTVRKDSGEVGIPVKLRVPEEAPMREVERIVMTLAHAGLVHIQYAAAPPGDAR